jgi:hypothetical protein
MFYDGTKEESSITHNHYCASLQDESIVKMVSQWPRGKAGMWVAIGLELTRTDDACKQRWDNLLSIPNYREM